MKKNIGMDCLETIFNKSNNSIHCNEWNYNLQISDIIKFSANNQNKYLDLAQRWLEKMLNWKLGNIIYRTIPWVMNQVILYKDKNIEIRLHDFSVLESETYLHNHINPFASICLEWWYIEDLWWVEDLDDGIIYEFKREYWWELILSNEILWKWLKIINTRKHYSWNILFNHSGLFHTIRWDINEKPPFTFIVKVLVPKNKKVEWKVYSPTKEINSPVTPIRDSNNNEIQSLMDRTSDWIKGYVEKSKIWYL